ncbi:hypothetical protein [Aeromonas sp. sia0103]|uniref:hypothetical protein n=1 Tax=Aeromonas sp. sia0103 TaxID=2854782 RepID=UPI001C4556F2|nr:hypothetical protein [Aeromonas sp. sia0103]MBV7598303.1 hypothetical protein [Aeromonas sp. sia0103]
MALIQIRATSLPTGYAFAFVSLKGCVYPMPMDFSGLLRRLLADSHIVSTSLKGEPGMPMDFSILLRRLLTDSHIDFTSLKGGA